MRHTSQRPSADLQTTTPVNVSVGAADGLQIDVTLAPDATTCADAGSALVLTSVSECCSAWAASPGLDQGSRMRLYLLDLPEGPSTRILAIAIVAPKPRFEHLLELAAPIVDSIEFHAP